MKKFMILLSLISFMSISCGDNRTPQQIATDEFNQEQAANKNKAMRLEIYTDSLLNIAVGTGKYKYMRENRLNAIELLKKEYPELRNKWDSIKITIIKGEF